MVPETKLALNAIIAKDRIRHAFKVADHPLLLRNLNIVVAIHIELSHGVIALG